MISIIRQDLEERIGEADILIELIIEASAMKKSVNKVAIAKSSLFLVLYNIVESTVSVAFEEIHEKMKHLGFCELSPKMQAIYSEYYFKDKNSKTITKLLQDTIDSEIKFPTLIDYLKRVSLFSGNLDARGINKLLSKYGIDNLTNKSKKELVIIKNKRNKLAHGESSFKSSGREFTPKELNSFKISVKESMDNLLDSVDDYIVNEKYLAGNSKHI